MGVEDIYVLSNLRVLLIIPWNWMWIRVGIWIGVRVRIRIGTGSWIWPWIRSLCWASSQVSVSCGCEPGTTATHVLSLIKDF